MVKSKYWQKTYVEVNKCDGNTKIEPVKSKNKEQQYFRKNLKFKTYPMTESRSAFPQNTVQETGNS